MNKNKGQINELVKEIDKLYNESQELIGNRASIINGNERLKYLCSYSVLLYGYIYEIAFLQANNWNSSISSITRDILECYSIIKKFEEFYINDTEEFDEYVKYLVLIDLEQDIKIYNEIKSDQTIIDTFNRDVELNTFILKFKNLLQEFFPNNLTSIDSSSEIKSIGNIIKQEIKNRSRFYEQKHVSIGRAISNNIIVKKSNKGNDWEGCYSIYRELCHFTHNSISSVQSRVLYNNKAIYNMYDKNLLSNISLAYYTGKEVFRILNELLVK